MASTYLNGSSSDTNNNIVDPLTGFNNVNDMIESLETISSHYHVGQVEQQIKVVGGVEVEKGRYPYMVNILNYHGNHSCGGSLVAPNFVMTAAHCRNGKKVELMRHDITDKEEVVELYDVVDVFVHPYYDGKSFSNDVCLFKLDRNVKFNIARPIKLDDGSMMLNNASLLTVMGWGLTNYETHERTDVLLEANLDYFSNTKCKEVGYPSDWIEQNMMCTLTHNKDACVGDSGGPLILNRGDAEDDILVGVVSWGYKCAEDGYPGVYSRVSQNFVWFQNIICEHRPDWCAMIAPNPVPYPSAPPTREIHLPTAYPSSGPTHFPISSAAPSVERSPRLGGAASTGIAASLIVPMVGLFYLHKKRIRKALMSDQKSIESESTVNVDFIRSVHHHDTDQASDEGFETSD